MLLSHVRRFLGSIRFLALCLLVISTRQTAPGQSILGNALSFNGTNQGVVITNFGNIAPTNEVTVEFWAYTTKGAVAQSAFCVSPDSNGNRFNGHINYNSTGEGLNYWDFGNTSGGVGRLGPVAPPTNSISNWVHYAFVSSQSGNSMTIYTNGVLQTNKTGRSSFVRGSYDLFIGGANLFPYRGSLDDFRVWSVARSAAEIQANYKAPLVGNEANLVIYYKFDSASGSVVTNSATATGATYNGALTNSPTWAGSVPSSDAQTVKTLAVTGNSNTVAQLNGTVNAGAYSASVWFEWGLCTTNNTNATTPATIANGSGSVAVSNTISGLIPGRIYHCRVVASNALGVVRGNDVIFGAPSVVINNSATLTNECHAAFTDPFAANPVTATGMPLALVAGGIHNVVLRNDGTIGAWGAPNYFQTNVPSGLSNITAVAAGFAHSLALKSDGTVVAWGAGTNTTGSSMNYGQSIVPAGLSNVVAVAAGYNHSMALKSNGTVTVWGNNGDSTLTNVPASVTNVMAIAAGQWFCLALKSNGTVVAWGDGNYGQTNVSGLSNIVAIAAGSYHGLALKSDSTVVAWGAASPYNYGQATVPSGLTNVIAIDSGDTCSAALKSDGTIVAWGDNSNSQTNVPASVTNVVTFTFGDRHGLAMKADGTVVGWGLSAQTITTFPSSATNLSLTVTTGGTFNTNNSPGSYSLGYIVTNSLGGTGVVSRTVVVQDKTPPVVTILGSNPMTNLLNVAFVDPGATALDACGGTFAVTTNSTVNVNVPGTYTVTYTSTDSSSNTTNAVRTVVVNPLRPSVTTLAATGVSSTSATLNGTVNPGGIATTAWFEWGLSSSINTNVTAVVNVGSAVGNVSVSNLLSGLTQGVVYHYRVAASNAAGVVRGSDMTFGSPAVVLNGASIMTNECHSAFADPGAFVMDAPWRPLTIAAGGYHNLVLKNDGTLAAAWGNNDFGQCNLPAGLSNVMAIAGGTWHSLALKSNGTVTAWGYSTFGQTSVPAGLTNVVAISAGYSHSLALKNDGTVVSWGSMFGDGRLNVPAGLSNVVAISAGTYFSMALKSDGTVVAWGSNDAGQTNIPVGLSNVVAIAGGAKHSLALKSDGTVVAWGGDYYGVTNVPSGLSNVVAIDAGDPFSLALKSDGTLVAWGDSYYGGYVSPGVSNVLAIGCGEIHSIALQRDGKVVAWGPNENGQTNVPTSLTNFIPTVTVSGSVDTNGPGTYVRTYTYTNSLGVGTTISRTIVVADNTAPVVTLLGNNPLLITNISNLPLVDPGATVGLDLCMQSTPSLVVSNNVNTNSPGTYTITYSATDSSGNTGIATRTVIVALPISPAPLIPGDIDNDGIVSESELNAVYGHYVTNSPWLAMTNVAGLGGTNVTFSLTNSVGGSFTVEYTTNLVDWQPLGAATPRFEFNDTNAPTSPVRHYRLRYP